MEHFACHVVSPGHCFAGSIPGAPGEACAEVAEPRAAAVGHGNAALASRQFAARVVCVPLGGVGAGSSIAPGHLPRPPESGGGVEIGDSLHNVLCEAAGQSSFSAPCGLVLSLGKQIQDFEHTCSARADANMLELQRSLGSIFHTQSSADAGIAIVSDAVPKETCIIKHLLSSVIGSIQRDSSTAQGLHSTLDGHRQSLLNSLNVSIKMQLWTVLMVLCRAACISIDFNAEADIDGSPIVCAPEDGPGAGKGESVCYVMGNGRGT